MDLLTSIDWVKSEIAKLPAALAWRESMLEQLRYCGEVIEHGADPSRLEHLTIGLLAARELEGVSPPELAEHIFTIQYELQRAHLPYATKVRLGIHKSR